MKNTPKKYGKNKQTTRRYSINFSAKDTKLANQIAHCYRLFLVFTYHNKALLHVRNMCSHMSLQYINCNGQYSMVDGFTDSFEL